MTLQIPRICKFNDIQFSVIKIDVGKGVKTYSAELLFGGRYVDYTGIFEDVFTITGQVTGDDNLEDLMAIFDKPEIITLTLPLTNQTTIQVLPEGEEPFQCTIFDNSSIGLYQFTATLQASKIRTQVSSTSIENNLLSSKFAFLKSIADTVVKTYKTTFRTINNAQNTITDITNKMTIASQVVPSALNKLEDFAQTIQRFQSSIGNFISLPAQLTAQVQNLVHTATTTGNTLINQAMAIKNLFSGDFITPYDASCSYLQENSNAIVPVQTAFYCYGLYEYINIVTAIEFESKQQLQTEIDYLKSVANYVKTRIVDYDLLNTIILLINNTVVLLKKKQSLLPLALEYDFYGVNDYAVCYMYYGNIDKIDQLRIYNNLPDYGIVDQKIRFI